MPGPHEIQSPSAWVVRWAHLIAARGEVLDVASGSGRHARYLAARGCRVVAVDRDDAALGALAVIPNVETLAADLEGAPWPFPPGRFDAVVVANYLHRPLFGHLVAALRPGGVLIYETFMRGNEALGRPSNPDFLLRPGELLALLGGQLSIVAFEQGRVDEPRPAVIQRVCAAHAAAESVTIG